MQPIIVVHGGAGAWQNYPQRLEQARVACNEAARMAQAILLAGGSALDAVETAVCILEDCPALDAGRGSYPNAEGEVEMDALIMDGRTLGLGAIAAVQRVRHPISLARRVMSDSPHCFFVGAGASAFADRIGFPRCSADELLVTASELGEPEKTPNHQPSALTLSGPLGDTVGAVALDVYGNLACATSTGGTRNKQPGRVGDSPLVGSGGYADNWTAAVSATGQGEALMKVIISKQVCDLVGMGLPAQAACETALRLMTERVGGEGGLIAIDARGGVGVSYNTNAMPHAYARGEGRVMRGE